MAKQSRKFPNTIGVMLQLDSLGRTQSGTVFTPKSMNRHKLESRAFLSGTDEVFYLNERRAIRAKYEKVSDKTEISNPKVINRYMIYQRRRG